MTTRILARAARRDPIRDESKTLAAVSSERPKGLAPCLFYLFVEFARPMAWVPILVAVHLGMLASAWGVITVVRDKARPIPRPLWYMFGLIALMAWHVPLAMNNAWALWGFQDFTFLVVGCVLPLAVLPTNLAAVRYLLSAYVFLHLPMAFHGLLHGGRGLTGWMGDENDLTLALNIATGIALFLTIETRSKLKRLVLLCTMGVMLATIVGGARGAAVSRGGFIGMAALGGYLLVMGPRRKAVAACMLLAVVGLFLFTPSEYWEQVQSIKTAGQPGDTGEQRFYLWGMAWRMFLDHPITGVGTRNYGIQAPYYEDTERAETTGFHTWGRVAHSLYLTLLSEQGLVGSFLFLAILGWFAKTQWRLRRAARARPADAEAQSAFLLGAGLSAGMFALLVTGAFITVIYYPLFWVLVGLMGSLDGVTPWRKAAGA